MPLFLINKIRFIRILYRYIRPASGQYISGDGYRKLATHIYDETAQSFSPEKVKQGDIVFMPTHYVARFFETLEPRINAKYILVTHNSDYPVDERLVSRAGSKIIKWFAQNNTFSNPKVAPIPIGLENLHHYNFGIPEHFDELRKTNHQKQNRILFGFNIQTNPSERQPAYQFASQCSIADNLTTWPIQSEYLKLLNSYKFVLAPPGNGLDTHRSWEAMYLGVVPIVKYSVAMESFQKLGLPLWMVREWDELLAVDENMLEKKYEEVKGGFTSPALFMKYWQSKIQTNF
jgi:hypothetical protein